MPAPENILIYRLGSLGDTVVALPCFHLIRRVFPENRIYLLTNKPVSWKAAPAMAILENSGLCDEAVSYPVGTRNVRELAKVRQLVRVIQPGLVINLTAGRGLLKSLRDNIFFHICGVKKIIGTPLHRRDFKVQATSNGRFESESQRLATRLRPLGVIDLSDRSAWKLGLSQKERNQSLEFLPASCKNYIVVSVGTKLMANDWGEENWGNLLAMLSKEMRATKLVLLGAADEWERSERLGKAWSGDYLNLCGKISPRVSAAILERCRLFVGHDSGPMHLAAAAGTSVVAIFSWHNPPGQWFPGQESWRNIKVIYPPLPHGIWKSGLRFRRSPKEGILLITPTEVMRACVELLATHLI